MPGKTEYEAVSNYREPILHAVQCLSSDAYLIPSPGSYNYSLGAEGYWRLGDENGLKLQPSSSEIGGMRFCAEQAYRIIECDPEKHEPELGCFRGTTTMYAYELTIDGEMAWQMHWHPDGVSEDPRPHYRLPAQNHLPNARHTIEQAVEWCIRYGAEPVVADWESRLAASRGVHELHRSWAVDPAEPRG